MTTVSEAEIAAARAYESLHVPALFQQWASLMADVAAVGPGDRVLDVACGTGVAAREIAARTGHQGRVVGLDAAPGMLAVAERLAPAIEWRQGLADALPFEAASFDAVVSQFGLMFFPDRPAAIRDMLRVLTPDGRLVVAVWDALERSEAYREVVALLERRAGPAAAAALEAPFVLGDRERVRDLFQEAGASSVEIATEVGTARFPGIRTMVEADLRGWLPVMGVQLDDTLIDGILVEAESVLAGYVTPEGRVEFDAPAHIVVSRRRQPEP